MASRYTYTEVIKEPDTNKSYMESTIYPRIKAEDNDFYVISEAGDRLDILAKKYYNNPALWWVIAVANNLNDANFFVQEGIQLRIPTDTAKILSLLKKVNE
jgi:nucleoid-associated protein YgaU